MNFAGLHSRLTELQRRLETVPDALADCIEYNKEEVLQLRKDEMLLGRDSDGHPFTPGYLEDPVFNDPKNPTGMTAEQYYKRKRSIKSIHQARIFHPLNYANKDDNTPNLRITVDRYNPLSFQDQMYIYPGRTETLIGSTFMDTHAIVAKYNGKVFDLGPLAKEWFWENILYIWLYNHIRGI